MPEVRGSELNLGASSKVPLSHVARLNRSPLLAPPPRGGRSLSDPLGWDGWHRVDHRVDINSPEAGRMIAEIQKNSVRWLLKM